MYVDPARVRWPTDQVPCLYPPIQPFKGSTGYRLPPFPGTPRSTLGGADKVLVAGMRAIVGALENSVYNQVPVLV